MSAPPSPQTRPESPAETNRAETNVVVWASISTAGVLLAGVVLLLAFSLLSWATDPPVGSTAGSATQVALQAWYLAHSIALPASWGALSVPPLLVTGFIALLFYRSGRGVVRACSLRTPAQIAEALAAVVTTYVTGALLLSSIAYPVAPMLPVLDMVIGTGSLSLVASLAGLLRESGLGVRLIARLPGPSYAYARGALAACWSLAGLSAIAVGVSLLVNYSETSALTAALSPDGLGGLTVIGISIAYLPNAMLLAVSLGSGAGFDLGAGSLYTLSSVEREALPIFPLFAALPHEAGGLALLSVLVPLGAALVGALTMTRHLEAEHRTVTNLLVGSVLCGVLTAAGVLGVALYAAGGLGDGRLSSVGVSGWRLAAFLSVELTVAVAVCAFIVTRRSRKPVSVVRREKALAVLETGEPIAAGVRAAGSAKQGASGPGAQAGKEDSAKLGGASAGTADGGAGPGGARKGTADGGVDSLDGTDATVSARGAAVGGAPERANRPVIESKLAMRRLTRGGKRTAQARTAAAGKQPKYVAKTAPAASLSVVKRARAAETTSESAPTEG